MRFVFATEEVGFKRYLPHLQITLTTLAEQPRLFALDNFLTEDDASQLIEDALAIQDDEHKLTRSSVGAKGYTVSSTRTSETVWESNFERPPRVDVVSVASMAWRSPNSLFDFHTDRSFSRALASPLLSPS